MLSPSLPRSSSRKLDASVGAPEPHDFAVRLGCVRLSHRMRPPHPLPNVRDDRETPLLSGGDGGEDAGDLRKARSEIFLGEGLDMKCKSFGVICPRRANHPGLPPRCRERTGSKKGAPKGHGAIQPARQFSDSHPTIIGSSISGLLRRTDPANQSADIREGPIAAILMAAIGLFICTWEWRRFTWWNRRGRPRTRTGVMMPSASHSHHY